MLVGALAFGAKGPPSMAIGIRLDQHPRVLLAKHCLAASVAPQSRYQPSLQEPKRPHAAIVSSRPLAHALERDDSSLNQGFALLDECDHIVSGLMDHSVIAAFHLRHRPCSDKSSQLCLEAEVLNPTIGTFFTMDAIHGKVGLPNFVLSQPGQV